MTDTTPTTTPDPWGVALAAQLAASLAEHPDPLPADLDDDALAPDGAHRGGGGGDGGPPWRADVRWWGPDEWRSLWAWVEWLRREWEIDSIPVCWRRHAAMVHELAVLQESWRQAWESDAGGVTAMTAWLDRLSVVLNRFEDPRRWGRGCTASAHEPAIPPPPSDEGGFEAWLVEGGPDAIGYRGGFSAV